LAEAPPICGKHKTLLASDTSLDPEAQLFQLCPNSQAETALARVDQDRDCRGGTEEMRDIDQGSFEGLKRALSRDQANGVLSAWNAACCRRSYAKKSASAERKIQFQAIVAGNDGPVQIG
jgi:hypothetical protein